MTAGVGPAAAAPCARCGTELAGGMLRCPGCGVLTQADALQRLAGEAQAAERRGDDSAALDRWREALRLLPGDAPQRAAVEQRIEGLRPAPGPPIHTGGHRGLKGAAIAIATAVLFLLGKLKLLLLGLTKLGTLLSMVAFFGVYWSVFGWKFALGLVLSIYVHEMGHVAALRHYGIPASAPMFIPGFGALVRLRAHPPTPEMDARVGLAGPLWGTGAALACLGLLRVTGNGLYASLAHVGAVLNLFNLIPVWQLDGGRGVAPLTRIQRGLLAATAAAAWAITREPVLLLVTLGLGVRALGQAQAEGDHGATVQFGLLLTVLGLLATVRVPGGPALP